MSQGTFPDHSLSFFFCLLCGVISTYRIRSSFLSIDINQAYSVNKYPFTFYTLSLAMKLWKKAARD
jgi:hypothetical protein